VAGWGTPAARDHKDRNCENADVPTNGLLGRQAVRLPPEPGTTPESSPAATARRAASRLNPGFSLWLMGYPGGWSYYSPGWSEAEWARMTLAAYYAEAAGTEPAD
jgi:hypothetical protein